MSGSHRPALLTALGVGRVTIGAGFLYRPSMFARTLGVDSSTAERVAWQGQMLGAREIGLGLGLLSSLRANPRPWVLAGALADGVDAYVFVNSARAGDVHRGAGLGLGVVAAATTVMALRAARRPRPSVTP